ncbi:MAG: hypothetical protein BWY45_01971 [Euryarchaeota archaeon ADurb.Bin294]|jgi:hypothetical protein|nr:MAG: hypothetical protein BWY45_01971 [Euryarchaeota archaeon ADurb.Bin294]
MVVNILYDDREIIYGVNYSVIINSSVLHSCDRFFYDPWMHGC